MRRQPSEQEYQMIDRIIAEVKRELIEACISNAPMVSPHEGYAVILEEVDELWNEVKLNAGTAPSAYHEAKQVAAMGARYMLDIASGVRRTG